MEKTCYNCNRIFDGGGETLFCSTICRDEAYTRVSQRSIIDFLTDEGIDYYAQKNSNFWYCSPFRIETKASFKVNLNRNLWYDFGLGEGGNIFQLVMKLKNLTQKSEAFKIIIERKLNLVQDFKSQPETPIIQINKIKTLENKALIQYLQKRGIAYHVARLYLKEAYYIFNHHNIQDRTQFFGLAFKNDKGGYELRPAIASFKAASSPKYYTTLNRHADYTSLNIFEGFMDFLSALVYFKIEVPINDTLILNSLSFVSESMKFIQKYKTLNLYLDNDTAGIRASQQYTATHPHTLNRSKQYYPNSKDFNEFLTGSK